MDLESKKTIEECLNTILMTPNELNQQQFVNTYNTIYSFCTVTSDTFYIEGQEIHQMVEDKIQEYTRCIGFKASLQGIFEQTNLLVKTHDCLSKVFSYLERFYISASKRKKSEIDSIDEYFYKSLYYNYISTIEESLVNILFLEIETARKDYNGNLLFLKTVIRFYIDILVVTNQPEKLKDFYESYIANFSSSTNFDGDVGKLLKRVYLEMYFITNIIGDKSLCRLIIDKISHRQNDIFEYICSKFKVFENCKHVFKIVSMMNDSFKEQFRRFYEEFVKGTFKSCKTFDEVHELYLKFKRQIEVNKMVNYNEILISVFKGFFIDKCETDQQTLSRALSLMIEKIIIFNNKALESCDIVLRNGQYIIDDKNGEFLDYNEIPSEYNGCKKINDKLLTRPGISESRTPPELNNVSHMLDGGEEPIKPPVYRRFESNFTFQMKDEAVLLIELFELMLSEYLIDLYTRQSQYRLIKGINPFIEMHVLGMMIERVGLGQVSRLNKSINTYISYKSKAYSLRRDDGRHNYFNVSLLLHTKGFWDLPESSVKLPMTLEVYLRDRIAHEGLSSKEKVSICCRASPIVFKMNKTVYKMNTDLFSLIMHLSEAGGYLTVTDLKSRAEDLSFDYNLKKLIDLRFVQEHHNILRLVNRVESSDYVDLFELENFTVHKEEVESFEERNRLLIESRICSMMKRAKTLSFSEAIPLLNTTSIELEEAIARLVSKGFITFQDEIITYVP